MDDQAGKKWQIDIFCCLLFYYRYHRIDSLLVMEVKPDPAKVLLINKPLRWTSFDVVKKIRYHFKLRKVGHAGTLDPLATGLLIVCTGKMTKEIQGFVDDTKEYTGTFTLGYTTPSYDLETEPAT